MTKTSQNQRKTKLYEKYETTNGFVLCNFVKNSYFGAIVIGVIFSLISVIGVSQNVGISTTGTVPNPSALLDIDGSPGNNFGLLIPRVTFLERTGANFNPLPAAAQSLLVYQTNSGGDGEGYYYNTSTTTTPAWTKLETTAGGVPSGAILYFATATCPTGWSEVTAAQGRYIVGLPALGSVSGTVGTALSDLENRPAGQHSHGFTLPDAGPSGISEIWFRSNTAFTNTTKPTDSGTGLVAGTNAPYIQFIVCQKN